MVGLTRCIDQHFNGTVTQNQMLAGTSRRFRTRTSDGFNGIHWTPNRNEIHCRLKSSAGMTNGRFNFHNLDDNYVSNQLCRLFSTDIHAAVQLTSIKLPRLPSIDWIQINASVCVNQNWVNKQTARQRPPGKYRFEMDWIPSWRDFYYRHRIREDDRISEHFDYWAMREFGLRAVFSACSRRGTWPNLYECVQPAVELTSSLASTLRLMYSSSLYSWKGSTVPIGLHNKWGGGDMRRRHR